jgi:alpha-glucosidase (family GH31 glycosyl hydrolase)
MDKSTSPLSNQRPFIMSRSTFAGSGKHVGHWLASSMRGWDDIKFSIVGIMNFNLFGIPMTGPDTCGYSGFYRNDEMCARWI